MNEYLSTKIGKQHLEGRNFLLQLHHIIFISIIWFKSTSFPTHFFSCKYCTHLFPVFSLFLITVCFLSFLFYSQHCFYTQWVIIMTVFPQIIDRVSNYILLFSDPLLPFLIWLIENFKLYMWLEFSAKIIFLLF